MKRRRHRPLTEWQKREFARDVYKATERIFGIGSVEKTREALRAIGGNVANDQLSEWLAPFVKHADGKRTEIGRKRGRNLAARRGRTNEHETDGHAGATADQIADEKRTRNGLARAVITTSSSLPEYKPNDPRHPIGARASGKPEDDDDEGGGSKNFDDVVMNVARRYVLAGIEAGYGLQRRRDVESAARDELRSVDPKTLRAIIEEYSSDVIEARTRNFFAACDAGKAREAGGVTTSPSLARLLEKWDWPLVAGATSGEHRSECDLPDLYEIIDAENKSLITKFLVKAQERGLISSFRIGDLEQYASREFKKHANTIRDLFVQYQRGEIEERMLLFLDACERGTFNRCTFASFLANFDHSEVARRKRNVIICNILPEERDGGYLRRAKVGNIPEEQWK